MTGIPSEHVRDVREALRIVISDPGLGATTLSNAAAMSNLLKDLLPDAPREKNLLVAAAEADLAGIMLGHAGQGIDAGSAIRLAAASFAANTHFTDQVCTWVATELAVALGIAPAGSYARSSLPDQPSDAEPAEPSDAEPAAGQELAPTRRATDLPDAVGGAATRPDTADAGTRTSPAAEQSPVATAPPARRRAGIGAVLMLVGLLGALAAYLIPVYYDSYYGGVKIWGSGLPSYVTQLGTIILVLVAACAAQVAFARDSRLKVATSSVLIACGVLILVMFVIIYLRNVRENGDQFGPGLGAGALSAVLLVAGGLAALLRQRTRGPARAARAS